MDDDELRELQDPQTWIDDDSEGRSPVDTPRAVVAVSFTATEFEQVARAARRRSMKTVEFVRQAALDRLDESANEPAFNSTHSGRDR